MLPTSRLVGVRYDAAHRGGHVESYFLKANDPKTRRAFWLKTTIYASARGLNGAPHALAEAWAVAFDGERGHVAVKSSVPFERARFSERGLDVRIEDVALRSDATSGSVESGGRSIAWDLALRSDGIPLVHFPYAAMYEGKFPSTKIVSPFPDLRALGHLTVNGERWEIDRWPGLLGHNWGPRHTPAYAWCHCNVWEAEEGAARSTRDSAPLEEELIFEGLSGRTPLGPVLSPLTTLLCLRWRGVRYELNTPLDLARNRGNITPRRWEFQGSDRHVALSGEVWAETDDFVGLLYENPSGPPTHCLNTKLAHARLSITVQGRPPLSVRSRAAALEIGTLDPTHGVRIYV
ncbi:MAG TPA: hypothetical protein VGI39_23515 [Polyangiaceae bacterium]|jgi:hypothetical protein